VTRAILRSDGGARGNPGPGGAGFVVEANDAVICRAGRFLGEVTNNVAEYEALIWGLENVAALGFSAVDVYADSELMVKQLNGAYRVKSQRLKPLYKRAMALVSGFASVVIRHVRREDNALADAMANEAMDERTTVGDPACEPGGKGPQATLF
jgi:ribonuclease HI